jgi:molecular chaperone HscA
VSLLQIAEPGQSRVKEACATRAVGIDLGTTNSLVAVVEDGQPVVLRGEDGSGLLPSVVAYQADGSVVVGAAARAAAPSLRSSASSDARRATWPASARWSRTTSSRTSGSCGSRWPVAGR